MHAEWFQPCLTLWDPVNCSLPDSSVLVILQARILEWVAMPFSRGSTWPRDQTSISCGSCTAGRFFITETQGKQNYILLLLLSHFSHVNLCNPVDGSPPGFPVPGILQARTLEWVSISLSSAWKWKVKVKLLSCVRLLATPWTAAYQAPPSVGFSRQEYWSGVPSPSLNLEC